MRKIVAGLFISLDGVVEAADQWMGPWFNPELGQAIGSLMGAQDAMLLGRVTYQEFAGHWPQQTGEMADTMNGAAKYVVSGTLQSADWQYAAGGNPGLVEGNASVPRDCTARITGSHGNAPTTATVQTRP
jgi:dihydrofolate reductase